METGVHFHSQICNNRQISEPKDNPWLLVDSSFDNVRSGLMYTCVRCAHARKADALR